jgi:AraC-like DNA-binding protein/mannose-6-phosphate isomerase-like protein (cupin superfamily)
MQPRFVEIPFETGQSFRSFNWTRSVNSIIVHNGSGRSQKKRGVGSPWHFHPEGEIILFKKGRGKSIIGDNIESFYPGDLFFLGSNLPHCWKESEYTSGTALQFNLSQNSPLDYFRELEALKVLKKRSQQGLKFINGTKEVIRSHMQFLQDMNDLQRLSTLLTIIDLMAHAPTSDQECISQKTFNLDTKDPNQIRIREIIEYTIHSCEKPLTLNEIASKFHTSKATLCRHVRKYTGKSFIQFLNEVRLNHARITLLETNETVRNVASQFGFNSLTNFNRSFKKKYKMTPRDYRKDGMDRTHR